MSSDDHSIAVAEPLSINCVYSPAGLQAAMGIGRSYYDTLTAAGLPRRKIGGRVWHPGRLTVTWIEEFEDGEQTGKR